jgi:hypothetical protein
MRSLFTLVVSMELASFAEVGVDIGRPPGLRGARAV